MIDQDRHLKAVDMLSASMKIILKDLAVMKAASFVLDQDLSIDPSIRSLNSMFLHYSNLLTDLEEAKSTEEVINATTNFAKGASDATS